MERLLLKNTKGIDISAEDGLEQRGIVVHGQTSMGAGYFGSGKAKLVIENKNTAEDTLKIRTTGKFEHYPLIEAKAEVNGLPRLISKAVSIWKIKAMIHLVLSVLRKDKYLSEAAEL